MAAGIAREIMPINVLVTDRILEPPYHTSHFVTRILIRRGHLPSMQAER